MVLLIRISGSVEILFFRYLFQWDFCTLHVCNYRTLADNTRNIVLSDPYYITSTHFRGAERDRQGLSVRSGYRVVIPDAAVRLVQVPPLGH